MFLDFTPWIRIRIRIHLKNALKYNSYYPELLFMLPCGLGVYKAKLASASGCKTLLGGPHEAWEAAHQGINYSSVRMFLVDQARAFYEFGARRVKSEKDSFSYVGGQEALPEQVPITLIGEGEVGDQMWEDSNSEDAADTGHFQLSAGGQPGDLSDGEDYACPDEDDDTEWFPEDWGEEDDSPSVEEDTEVIIPPTPAALKPDKPKKQCKHICYCSPSAHNCFYSIGGGIKRFFESEALVTESTFKCLECRNCVHCRKGEKFEFSSFREEEEQAAIEASVQYDPVKKVVIAKLPFIPGEQQKLQPNEHIARKIFNRQMDKLQKKPELREMALKSVQKLIDAGHMVKQSDLSPEEVAVMNQTEGCDYFIPWGLVEKEDSVSTPVRMVFNASSKTPGGTSLNDALMKGRNQLAFIPKLVTNFRLGREALAFDVSMCYNQTKLAVEHYRYQKFLWKDGLDPAAPLEVWIMRTAIYGVRPAGNLSQAAMNKLADDSVQEGQDLDGSRILLYQTYVDDGSDSGPDIAYCERAASEVVNILGKGSMTVKVVTISKRKPCEKASADGVHTGFLGYLWAPEEDLLKLNLSSVAGGRAEDIYASLEQCCTLRKLCSLLGLVFDPTGLFTPITARIKRDLHEVRLLQPAWDDPLPSEVTQKWQDNIQLIQQLAAVRVHRTVIPEDAANTVIHLLIAVDASKDMGAVAAYTRVLRRNGLYSCNLILGKSKVMSHLTIPRAELKAAVIGAVSTQMLRDCLGDRLGETIFVTDSVISLCWMHQMDKQLDTAVRNAVIEIKRLTCLSDWYHVNGDINIADLATRDATVSEVDQSTVWQEGYDWMKLPRESMPIRSYQQTKLSMEEKRLVAAELRNKQLMGLPILLMSTDRLVDCYSFSEYLLDPCKYPWEKVLRVMALVYKYKAKLSAYRTEDARAALKAGPPSGEARQEAVLRACTADPQLATRALNYYLRLATLEVKKFGLKSYAQSDNEVDGIIYHTGRIPEGQEPGNLTGIALDLVNMSYVKPVALQQSPVSYSVMIQSHVGPACHRGAVSTLRESMSVLHIIGGKELAVKVCRSCPLCKAHKARMVKVEMGKVHANRLTIAPPFTMAQMDIFGPYQATCKHNHRSSCKLWGLVVKCCASGAVMAYCMSSYDAQAFAAAYTRHAAHYGHTQRLFIDEGTQLKKAAQQMEWGQVLHGFNTSYGVGIEYLTAPVGGHNANGMAERAIQEIKRLYDLVYKGLKFDCIDFETSLAWISNELNNFPMCLGTEFRSLEELDLLTPNRLLLGKNNRACLSGPCVVAGPKRMVDKQVEISKAWWTVWQHERLPRFMPASPLWRQSDPAISVGDIVTFAKTGSEHKLGEPVWRIGRVIKAVKSADGQVRQAEVEYRHGDEATFRTTTRSVRTLAVLQKEEDIELTQELNLAARTANRLMILREVKADRQQFLLSTKRGAPAQQCELEYSGVLQLGE